MDLFVIDSHQPLALIIWAADGNWSTRTKKCPSDCVCVCVYRSGWGDWMKRGYVCVCELWLHVWPNGKHHKIHSLLAFTLLIYVCERVCTCAEICVRVCARRSDHKSWPTSCYWLSWQRRQSEPMAHCSLQLGVKVQSGSVAWNRLSEQKMNRETSKGHIIAFYLSVLNF